MENVVMISVFKDLINWCKRGGCHQCPMWRPDVKDGVGQEKTKGQRNCMITNRPREWATGEIDHAILEIKRRVENIKKNGDYFGSKTSFD